MDTPPDYRGLEKGCKQILHFGFRLFEIERAGFLATDRRVGYFCY